MSHTFKSLKSQVTPGGTVCRCAERTPLVHCIRSREDRDMVIRFLTTGDITDFQSKESTRKACNTLGIPEDSTFFYAGRAFPESGVQVAMLYGGAFDADKSISDRFEALLMVSNTGRMSCGARPFDSGGLEKGRLKLGFDKSATAKNGTVDISMYFNDHNVTDLAEFRPYFALFVKEFFAKPADYWCGVPQKAIDGTMFGLGDDLRNWTFEVHSKWKVSPSYAGDIIIGTQVEHHVQHQAGFGGNPSLAPILKKSSRFNNNPSGEAYLTAKNAELSKERT